MAKRNYLVDIDLNKNELQNAVIHNVNSLPILTAANLVDVGQVIYLVPQSRAYILNNVSGIATWEPMGSGSGGAGGGGIFVMGVTANVAGENAAVVDSNGDNEDITKITATTKNLKFNLLALTGSKNLKPTITYTLGNDSTIYTIPTFDKHPDRPVYLKNDYVINVGNVDYITFIHEDGATKKLTILTDVLPIINNVEFTGGYPTFSINGTPYTQTDLKENDTVQITVEANETIKTLTVYNEAASKGYSQTYTDNLNLTTRTVSIPIAARTTGSYGVVVTVTNDRGSTSAKYYSANDGSVNMLNVVNLNNVAPEVPVDFTIGYQGGYTAISTTSQAQVALNLINKETTLGDFHIQYSSPSGQLTIPTPNDYQSSKVVTTSWVGYNVGSSNYTVSITKLSNGKNTTRNATVWIASAVPTITMVLPATRLISAPAGQLHTITANSNQLLKSLTLNTAGTNGVWNVSNNFTVNGNTATNVLKVLDSVTKGTYNFGGLQAINIAGVVANTTNTQYIIGGFASREVTMAGSARTVSFPNIAVTQVGYDTGKCIISWRGQVISATAEPTGPRFAVGTPLSQSQPKNNAWCIDATSDTPRTTEVRFLNFSESDSSSTKVTIQENA